MHACKLKSHPLLQPLLQLLCCVLQLGCLTAVADEPPAAVAPDSTAPAVAVSVTDIPPVAAAPASISAQIDQLLDSGFHGPEIPLATDTQFLRRVYLDLTGHGPTLEETQAFLQQIQSGQLTSTAARTALIDDLLEREQFSRYYAEVLEVMFTERREVISYRELRNFIRQWLEQRRPLNELCLELLAGDGTGEQQRATASFIINRNADPHLVTRDIGRIIFGRDVQCAQCHDHPLVADYEQAEYFGILSFVHRTYLFQDEKRGNLPYLGEKADGLLEFASVFKPQDPKSAAQPVLPMAMAMDTEPQFVDEQDAYVVVPDKEHRGVPQYSRRQQLAVLATHRENHAFNRNLANRLWSHLFGTGLVHPVDLHHRDNPPSSAALLRLLADSLVAGNYDLRQFLRQIALTRAYQRSSIPPDIASWDGPPDGLAAVQSRLTETRRQITAITPRLTQLNTNMQAAAERLQLARRDVDAIQQRIQEARTTLQKLTADHTQAAESLKALQTRITQQNELITSLTATLTEADKILKITPADQDLVNSRTLFETRLKAAQTALPELNNQLSEQQEMTENAQTRVEDQRGRIHALANRSLALGEFVVEARGIQRKVRSELQQGTDQITDLEQSVRRDTLLQNFLQLRLQSAQTALNPDSAPDTELAGQLQQHQTQLLQEWQRCFAIRQPRSLTPEQLARATYTGLALDRPVREKAAADWLQTHQDNPAVRDDQRQRQLFINTALAVDGPWEVLEDLIVERFSAPAGTPQDGFFATVDQALALQNSAEYLNLLKPASGSLAERLIAMDSQTQLAETLYLSVLCRPPDAEETQMVVSLLTQHPQNKAEIVQELLWGLLSSSEFRFMF